MAAAAGAPTREALKARFPEAAHRAISAALVYEAGGPDETFRAIVARLRARVTGLPREPAEGDSAPAVLSRARHALLNGDLDSALAAVEALPPAARTAMDGWVVDARLRAEADHALAQWRGDLKAAL